MRQLSTLDLRPSVRSSLPSSSSFSVRDPLHTLSRSPPAPTSPTGIHHHHHPVREIVLSLSISLRQVRLSGPSHSPYPCPQPCLCPRCLSNFTLANPSVVTYPPTLPCTAVIPSSSTSLFLSSTFLAYLRLLTTFTLDSVGALPCQFLCETTNGAIRYLPTYLPSYLPSWLATYSRKTRWGCKLRITEDAN